MAGRHGGAGRGLLTPLATSSVAPESCVCAVRTTLLAVHQALYISHLKVCLRSGLQVKCSAAVVAFKPWVSVCRRCILHLVLPASLAVDVTRFASLCRPVRTQAGSPVPSSECSRDAATHLPLTAESSSGTSRLQRLSWPRTVQGSVRARHAHGCRFRLTTCCTCK